MRKWLKKFLPQKEVLNTHPKLGHIKHLMRRPYLWSLNRRACSRAVGIGIMVNFLPLPLQMVWAALMCLWCHANIPLAVALTWINNPFTFIPIIFFTYFVGQRTLMFFDIKTPPILAHNQALSDLTFTDLVAWLYSLGMPYLIGVVILSIGGGLMSYTVVNCLWRAAIVIQHRQRHKRRS